MDERTTSVDAERERRLRADYNAACVGIQKGLPSNRGGKAAEAAFAIAYQKLVAAGLKPQIKLKYRSSK